VAGNEKALRESHAGAFFVLCENAALEGHLSELERLYGVPQPRNGIEIDTAAYNDGARSSRLLSTTANPIRRIGTRSRQGLTRRAMASTADMRAQRRTNRALCDGCGTAEYANSRDRGALSGNVHRAFELRPSTVVDLLERRCLQKAERFEHALLACEADSRGRLGLEQSPYPQREYLQRARLARRP